MLSHLSSFLPDLVEAFPAIDVVYVFGSAVSGGRREGGDVDVAIDVQRRALARDALLDLRIALWLQDRLGCPVDVVVMNRTSAIMRHEVLRTGVRLYERSPVRRAEHELHAFKEYLDMRYFQRKREQESKHGERRQGLAPAEQH